MNEICAYKLLEGYSPESLSAKVQDAVSDGWQPFGSPFVGMSEHRSTVFCQAVVKYKK